MLCGDCPWCIVNFRCHDMIDFFDGFVCSYGDSSGFPFEVRLSDNCHLGFSASPQKPVIII